MSHSVCNTRWQNSTTQGHKSWSHGMTNVSIPQVNMLKNSSIFVVSVTVNLSVKLGLVSLNGLRETYFLDKPLITILLSGRMTVWTGICWGSSLYYGWPRYDTPSQGWIMCENVWGLWNKMKRNEWDECGEMVEWNLREVKKGEPRENLLPSPIRPPRTRHGETEARTRDPAVGGKRSNCSARKRASTYSVTS